MVDYKYAELYTQDSIDKQVKIEYDGGTITNAELFSESMELTESLCSESELRFGCCEASALKFKVANIMTPLSGKWLTVSETLAENNDVPFKIGKYKVYSDKPTADRRYREITAYDAMYDIINADVADWYNTILPNANSTVTLKAFRTSFIQHFGLEQENVELINDAMVVQKTIEPSEISGRDVLTAICEINGCFGHIGRDGKFRYVHLPKYAEGLYPANDLYPADDLYPREPQSTGIGKGLYIGCQYEDFVTKSISKLQIRQEENDIGTIVGTGDNCYIIEDNFLVYGKSAADLKTIANNVYGVVKGVRYRPFEADCKGNPCFEVGDAVRLATKYEIVESYILNRTLKGIQALRDTYSAEGVEEYSEKVNSLNRSIIQLKGKTNVLERTVEETKSTITDVEEGLQSEIKQRADSISAEVTRATKAEEALSGRITVEADNIALEVSRATKAEGELSSKIEVTATEIRSEVTSANDNMQSQIIQNKEGISLKVSKDSVVSEINQSAEKIKIAAEKLELKGNMEMTGGSVNITASAVANSIIHLGRKETSVDMGTDGLRSTCTDGREAIFQYSNITIQNGDLIAQLTQNGKGISSYGWESYSDQRLKYDIEAMDLEERAAFIYAQRPCRYKYVYDPEGHYRHGLIAQDVESTIGNEDWAVVGENVNPDGETYLTLDKLELIADLIATVQSQNKRIIELEERMAMYEQSLQ